MNEIPKELICYAIYDHPKDYPDSFVVRRWVGQVPDVIPTGVADTLEQARALIPRGLSRIPHQASEDPIIAETWI